MWMQPRAISAIQTEYLAALGRAIALAQNFENNCKFVFGTIDFGEAFAAKKIDLKSWQEFGKKLMRRSLGAALKGRESDDMFENHIVALDAARVARNYLAHQAAEPALYVAPPSGKQKLLDVLRKTVDRHTIEAERQEMVASYLRKMLPQFEKAVRDLAEGDSIVSKWSYMIQEKDALPAVAAGYADDVVEWVLAPIRL